MTAGKLEAMAYKMQPAGHEEPSPRRKYEKPTNKLKEAYENWLKLNDYANHDASFDNQKKCYYSALELTKRLEFGLADVHGLLLEYTDNLRPHLTGLFISALYRKVPEKEIIFDLPLEEKLHFVGFNLPEDKTLISRIPTGSHLGKRAAGTIINANHTGDQLGSPSTGVVINYGDAGGHVGTGAEGRIINYSSCTFGLAATSKAITVNMGDGGHEFADGLNGIAINFGIAGDGMGKDISYNGLLINYGKAGHGLGDNGEGTILCFKNPKSYGENSTRVFIKKPEECTKYGQLKKYLDNLKTELEKGRNDYKTAIEVAKKLNKSVIERKLPKDVKQRDKLEYPDDMLDTRDL